MAMDGLCIGVFFGIKGHSPAYIESKTEYWSSTYGWEKKGTFYPTMLLGQDLRLTASTFFELMQHFCVSSCVMSNARLECPRCHHQFSCFISIKWRQFLRDTVVSHL
jgi:hypothetical protein